MESKRLATWASLLAGLAACAMACGGPEVDFSKATLELEGYSVHRVRLEHPAKVPDAAGRVQAYDEAFLVRLNIEKPPFWGPAVRIQVGGYTVPEHGDWAEGLYFRVYSEKTLRSLAGGELSYRIGTGPVRQLGARFELPPIESLELTPEAKLLGR